MAEGCDDDAIAKMKVITAEGMEFEVAIKILTMFKAIEKVLDLSDDGKINLRNGKPLQLTQGEW